MGLPDVGGRSEVLPFVPEVLLCVPEVLLFVFWCFVLVLSEDASSIPRSFARVLWPAERKFKPQVHCAQEPVFGEVEVLSATAQQGLLHFWGDSLYKMPHLTQIFSESQFVAKWSVSLLPVSFRQLWACWQDFWRSWSVATCAPSVLEGEWKPWETDMSSVLPIPEKYWFKLSFSPVSNGSENDDTVLLAVRLSKDK